MTHTKDEALKLALEALVFNNKEWKSLADSGDAGFWSAEEQDHYKQTEEAIKALEEALSKQEQGVPVGVGGYLTTTTPQQRTWVGLTDDEIEQGIKESWVTEQAFQSAVWWAEAKLKEKNT